MTPKQHTATLRIYCDGTLSNVVALDDVRVRLSTNHQRDPETGSVLLRGRDTLTVECSAKLESTDEEALLASGTGSRVDLTTPAGEAYVDLYVANASRLACGSVSLELGANDAVAAVNSTPQPSEP